MAIEYLGLSEINGLWLFWKELKTHPMKKS